MEFVWVPIALFLLFIGGLACAGVAVYMTRNAERMRGIVVLLAFFLPTIFMAYLMGADSARNQFHHARNEASNEDGSCTLPLPNGYSLNFYDEMPWDSYIARTGSPVELIPHIAKVHVQGLQVVGAVAASTMRDGPVDSYFALDLTNGSVQRYPTAYALLVQHPDVQPLEKPAEAFHEAEASSRSRAFWPIVLVVPFCVAFLCSWLLRERMASKT